MDINKNKCWLLKLEALRLLLLFVQENEQPQSFLVLGALAINSYIFLQTFGSVLFLLCVFEKLSFHCEIKVAYFLWQQWLKLGCRRPVQNECLNVLPCVLQVVGCED